MESDSASSPSLSGNGAAPSGEASDQPSGPESLSSPKPRVNPHGDGSGTVRDGSSPLKRSAEPSNEQQPSKRYKPSFNHAYMDLLNIDIEDAANQVVLEKRPLLKPKQVGMLTWTSLEKDLFYEALARVGKDDLSGIASRVRTKSELEIRQYLKLVEDQHEQMQSDPHYRWEDHLQKADYPAAKELGEACCDALEEVADDMSLRIERHEQKTEEKKWGGYWLITTPIAKLIDEDSALEHPLDFAELFNLQSWLRLPKRVYMNSSCEGENWQDLSDEAPAIRATALKDFHALTIAVTRKLILSSLYTAQSRIKAKQVIHPNIRKAVKVKDVEGALASAGMKRDSRRYWATCARRLGLQVHDTPFEDGAGLGADDDEPPMSYAEVEKELLLPCAEQPAQFKPRVVKPWKMTNAHTIDFELSDTSSASGEDAEQDTSSLPSSDDEDEATLEDEDEELAVHDEVNEALLYTVNALPKTHRTQEAVEMRVRLDRAQEKYAEAIDAQGNYEEEKAMWALVRKSPPEPLVKPDQAKTPPKSTMRLQEVHDSGARWRNKLEYASEWELHGFSKLSDPTNQVEHWPKY
ncbi:hypothetical protein D7B24_002591 [Verticillium nonalfalfae]|uniref:Myb-like domain-containing protein n=1 Tax=Verticillium nonalfalfae TaxID=1051616 RepID=A0A3M9XYW2_9PEZI|nr:uncharacterized protein D7B24_002591 [Verticillium nonalfalfae]RNJ52972.1 hypothetical protein D7B24_002591 [Verticillium nonalfalfae]